MVDEFYPGANADCTARDGKLICLRNDIAPNIFYYNVPKFEEFGYTVPTTWEEYIALAEKVAEETGKLDDKNREAAERTIRTNFIYDRIAEKENIEVTENEVENELRQIAMQQNRNVNDVRRQYEEKNLLAGLENFMRNQKIRKTLSDHARIVEKDAEGQVIDDEASSGAEENESSQSESP